MQRMRLIRGLLSELNILFLYHYYHEDCLLFLFKHDMYLPYGNQHCRVINKIVLTDRESITIGGSITAINLNLLHWYR